MLPKEAQKRQPVTTSLPDNNPHKLWNFQHLNAAFRISDSVKKVNSSSKNTA
jgi:hypothetical protein